MDIAIFTGMLTAGLYLMTADISAKPKLGHAVGCILVSMVAVLLVMRP